MRVYTAGLIEKPLRSINNDLRKRMASDLRKSLRIRSSAVDSQELNTFILVSGETTEKGIFNPNLIEEIEKGAIYKRFMKYYNGNESRFRKYMKNNTELNETSNIVKDFIKEIDSSLPKRFDDQLKKINTELPKTLCELSSKSFITLWDIEENQEFRLYLTGFDFPVFTGNTSESLMGVNELVDKLLIVNFFVTFLKPTLLRLDEMHIVLNKLEQIIEKQHYKTNNKKTQSKFELFLRILVAKLSALHELDNLIYRIFNLFEIPRMLLAQSNFKSEYLDFNTVLARISDDIQTGKSKLQEVSTQIQRCQLCFRDYLDEGVNGVKAADSLQEFKEALKPLTDLSVDLFIETELLKMWSDFFGSDIPHFSFNVQLFNSTERKQKKIEEGQILSVKGLFKNYNLGRTTVYALRGLNLDIKEGEFVAIIGPSGAGKTTLLNCMAGLDEPDHGAVYFRGKNLHGMKDSSKSRARLLDMGFIFQSYALLPHFNTRENVTLPADLAGGLSKGIKRRIEDLLQGVGIDQQAEQFPAQISGGQMQRVAIARALTNQPAIIFADEPTGDLDSGTGKQVMDLLKKFHEETNTTIIIITHEEDIAAYAERQVVMEDGVITKH